MGDAFKDAGPGERSVYDRTGLPEVAAISRMGAGGDDLAALLALDDIELYRAIKTSGAKKRIDMARAVIQRLEPRKTILFAHIAALTAERDDYADQISTLLPAVNREAVEQRARAEAAEAERDALTAERDEARSLAAQLQSECEELHSDAAALRAKVARLEGAGDFARLIGNDTGKDDKDTVLVSYGMLRRLRAALTDGGKDE